jgi:tetratricopeptide (TPR) repeat protein/ADP-heptose:LPS heptosyltransferase
MRQENHSGTPASRGKQKGESGQKPLRNSAEDISKRKYALALINQGRLREAETVCRALVSLGVSDHIIYCKLGAICLMQGRYKESVAFLQKSINLESRYSEAQNNLGVALKAQGNITAALACFERAIQLKPGYSDAHYNLGLTYQEQGVPRSAIAAYLRSLQCKPNYIEAYNNLGVALREMLCLSAASICYKIAIQLDASNPEAHWNMSQILLLKGNYKTGWQEYEWRSKRRTSPINPHALAKCPHRHGELPLNQVDCLLVITEQGLGDTLQFMRYMIALRRRGAKVSLCAQQKLHSLIQASNIDPSPLTPDQAKIFTKGQWISLLSLPKHLDVTPESPIITEPYIMTTDALRTKWKQILSNEQRPIIGINWQGNPETEKRELRGRSLPLETFSTLALNNQVSLLSLQKGYGSEQLETCSFRDRFVDCQIKVNETWGFLETAAIIANCDLIITSDTAVAHLAGGMGKRTWLLLHMLPDWRWGLYSETTFWYPTMRLFRQTEPGNWNEVLQRVAEELQRDLGGMPANTWHAKEHKEQAILESAQASSLTADQYIAGRTSCKSLEEIYHKNSDDTLVDCTRHEISSGYHELTKRLKSHFEHTPLGMMREIERATSIEHGRPGLESALNMTSTSQNIMSNNKESVSLLVAEAHKLVAHGEVESAIRIYLRILCVEGASCIHLSNLGALFNLVGKYQLARRCLISSLGLNNQNPHAYMLLGNAMKGLGALAKAKEYHLKALKINPECAEAHYNLGSTLKELGETRHAIDHMRVAVRLSPGLSIAHWNLSLALLLQGEYQEGLEEYEWRDRHVDRIHARPSVVRWNGCAKIEDDTLTVVSEQGLGDILQFMRYVNLLSSGGIRINFIAPLKLHDLIRESNIADYVISPDRANTILKGAWVPLMSIPKILGVTPQTPMANDPYISTNKKLLNKWRSLIAREHRVVVGICWQGNPRVENSEQRGRSLPLEKFSKIARMENISLLSLQKGFGGEQLETCSFKDRFVGFQDLVNQTWDFLETAAVIASCDLVITTDTSVAHLAGGMGKSTWLLLKKVPDWRWGLEGEETFWYPSIRLFRQREHGNWDEVMDRVAEELKIIL